MVFIVYFALTLSGGSIDPESVTAVSITTPDGVTTELNEEVIPFYVEMYLESDPLSEPLRSIAEETPLSVTIKQKALTTEFDLYAEANTNGCFFRKEDGKFYSVPSDFARRLLQRQECAFVYEKAGHTLPTLSFITDESTKAILPAEYAWQYKDIVGNAVTDTVTKKTDTVQFYSFYSDAGFALRFSKDPARYTVTFYKEDGTALDASDPTALIFPTDTKLTAVIEATWEQDSTSVGGTASYSFDLLYDVLPEIIRSTESVKVGDTLCIGFRHLSESEKISLETQLITSDIRVNYEEGSAYALLPISAENSAGEYTLKFTIGNIVRSIDLKVSSAEGEFEMCTMDTEKYTKYVSPEFKQSYAALMSGWASSTSEPFVTAGSAFGKPCDGDAVYTYGTDLMVNGLPNQLLEGNDYTPENGASIKASQRGVVIYAAEDEVLGNMVVIDHGYGIKTHYYGLGTVGKAVGDTVQKGEIIGTAGISGLTYSDSGEKIPTLHFYVSLDGTYVNPEPLLKDGLYILN